MSLPAPNGGDSPQILLWKIALYLGAVAASGDAEQPLLLKIANALANIDGAGTGSGEPALGNPASDGRLLSSTAAGVRSWVVPFNPAAPGPIGEATPGSATFTTLSTSGDIGVANGIYLKVNGGLGNVLYIDAQNCLVASQNFGPLAGYSGATLGNATRQWPSIYLGDAGGYTVITVSGPDALALRNGLNAQKFILSKTYTNATNYSQVEFSTSGANATFTLAGSGTGATALTGFLFNGAVTSLTSVIGSVSSGYGIQIHESDIDFLYAGVLRSKISGASGSGQDIVLASGAGGAVKVFTNGTDLGPFQCGVITATNIPTVDTGWTANADAGDKTKVVPASASLATIATALNVVAAGSGTALQATAEKIKAIEAALVALKLPNA